MQGKTAWYNLWANRIALLLVLLGIALRIIVYFQNRSLFLDEANLARNIAEQSFGGFFAPLDYHQYAPPLLGVIEKVLWLMLGSNELALRLFPLVLGLVLLVLFYVLCKQTIGQPGLWWFPLFMMAFSVFFLRYATEVKQYGTDAFSTCLLLFLALRHPPERIGIRQIWLWLLIGMLIIWFSMPSVFVLSGVGLYYLHGFWKADNRKKLGRFSLVIAGWLFSFGLYYMAILSADLSKDFLLDYHSVYFLPILPTTGEEWSKLGNILLSLFNTAIGYTVWAYILSAVFFLSGLIHLLQCDKIRLILFVVPLLSCFLASGSGFYSLMPRLTLFIIPVLLLIIAIGAEFIFLLLKPSFRPMLILSLLSLIPLQKGYEYFFKPYQIEEIRPVLAFVHEHQQTEDWIYLHEDALPAWHFYQFLHDKRERFQLENVAKAIGYDSVEAIIPNRDDKGVWLVFSHLLSDFSRQQLRQNREIMGKTHRLEKTLELEGAAAYYYIPKN